MNNDNNMVIDKVWVGTFEGVTYIHDPSENRAMYKTMIKLFDCSTKEYKNFLRDIIINRVTIIDDPEKVRHFMELYRNSRKVVRATHCYECHKPLSNANGKTCSKCGWIICSCGACGCSYQGSL